MQVYKHAAYKTENLKRFAGSKKFCSSKMRCIKLNATHDPLQTSAKTHTHTSNGLIMKKSTWMMTTMRKGNRVKNIIYASHMGIEEMCCIASSETATPLENDSVNCLSFSPVIVVMPKEKQKAEWTRKLLIDTFCIECNQRELYKNQRR